MTSNQKKNTKSLENSAPKNVKIKLPYKQELFCRYYIETSGNKTLSALLAFDIKNREIALRMINKQQVEKEEMPVAWASYFVGSVMGSEYFEKPRVKNRIEELIDTDYFTDGCVKQEHTKIILQDKDLSTKKGGIEMYYKLKGKFAPEKTEVKIVDIDIPDYKDMTTEQLKMLEMDIAKKLSKK